MSAPRHENDASATRDDVVAIVEAQERSESRAARQQSELLAAVDLAARRLGKTAQLAGGAVALAGIGLVLTGFIIQIIFDRLSTGQYVATLAAGVGLTLAGPIVAVYGQRQGPDKVLRVAEISAEAQAQRRVLEQAVANVL